MQTHQLNRTMHPCPLCDKEFTKVRFLLNLRLFSCDIRGSCWLTRIWRFSFPMQKSNLTVHTRVVHLGEKAFVCPVEGCGETFAYKHKMARHIRTHRSHDEPDPEVCRSRY
jgi:hypothetical protein